MIHIGDLLLKIIKMKKNKSTSDTEEEIKISFNTRRNKTLIITSMLLMTGFIGSFVILEYVQAQNRIILATTTSTYDSGLLDDIIPEFEEKYGIFVEVLSVGTGQALETGEKGDADVLLVHARSLEDEFVDNGYGIHRVCVMYNDFIIVGPSSDPAGINEKNISAAMSKLKKAGEAGKVKFYSRGDNSGTHTKELKLWKKISFTPDPSKHEWYLETGAGMGNTLTTADDNDGYTLIDRGTWLASKDNVDLTELVSGEEILLNPYGAILVNPEVNPNVKYEYAKIFVAFLVSKEGQELIGDFRKNGEKLFKPLFGICDEINDCSTTEKEIEYWKDLNGEYKGPSSDASLITQSFL